MNSEQKQKIYDALWLAKAQKNQAWIVIFFSFFLMLKAIFWKALSIYFYESHQNASYTYQISKHFIETVGLPTVRALTALVALAAFLFGLWLLNRYHKTKHEYPDDIIHKDIWAEYHRPRLALAYCALAALPIACILYVDALKNLLATTTRPDPFLITIFSFIQWIGETNSKVIFGSITFFCIARALFISKEIFSKKPFPTPKSLMMTLKNNKSMVFMGLQSLLLALFFALIRELFLSWPDLQIETYKDLESVPGFNHSSIFYKILLIASWHLRTVTTQVLVGMLALIATLGMIFLINRKKNLKQP